MKIRPVGAELFHADGQTDRTKLIVAFLNSVNAPKNEGLIRSWDFDKDRLAWLLRIEMEMSFYSHGNFLIKGHNTTRSKGKGCCLWLVIHSLSSTYLLTYSMEQSPS
jgi:hypothetical protein